MDFDLHFAFGLVVVGFVVAVAFGVAVAESVDVVEMVVVPSALLHLPLRH